MQVSSSSSSLSSKIPAAAAWLPDSHSQILNRMCLALRASGLWLRYTTLQNLIPSFPWIGIQFCYLATLGGSGIGENKCLQQKFGHARRSAARLASPSDPSTSPLVCRRCALSWRRKRKEFGRRKSKPPRFATRLCSSHEKATFSYSTTLVNPYSYKHERMMQQRGSPPLHSCCDNQTVSLSPPSSGPPGAALSPSTGANNRCQTNAIISLAFEWRRR